MTDEEAVRNLAERIAAAYVSYVSGHKGVDRTLKIVRGRKLGQFWLTTADAMLKAFSKGERDALGFNAPVSKYIQ